MLYHVFECQSFCDHNVTTKLCHIFYFPTMPFAYAVPGAFLLSYNAVCFCCSRCFSAFLQCRLLLLFQVLFYFLTMPFAFAVPGAFLLSHNAVCFCCSRCFSTFLQCRLLLLLQVRTPKCTSRLRTWTVWSRCAEGVGVWVCACVCVCVWVWVWVWVWVRERVCVRCEVWGGERGGYVWMLVCVLQLSCTSHTHTHTHQLADFSSLLN